MITLTEMKISRFDLANKTVKIMQERDDDATLTQLTQAWVNIALVSFFLFNF